ncbi:GDSL-type esterase/lipase family protein [uncultured Sphingomonas sp.]|mgnify:CR=1 FL=1|uniref:GDSL-type esterase/lipase family protein n=1 Tax=uncultured Sphingomonas sp. TaxID=158754 RepID=UPI0025DC429F|nr:GDSL-type esterase/lipase family protein [uncultured Sphingomonas sp.]
MKTWLVAATVVTAVTIGSTAIAQIDLDPKQQWTVEWHKRLNSDWPFLARYGEENAKLVPTPDAPRIVFMGDSITEGWVSKADGFFTPGRIGRGIGGQTTPQMLARFRQDVIDLKPAVVHIMAGTNDIAGNTGPMTAEQTKGNIKSMVELAHANGIRVILASIPPADRFPWKPGLKTGEQIVALNRWLQAYAARAGCVYADYWGVLHAPGTLGMRDGLSSDHVHPTEAGYDVMAPVGERAIKAALALPAPPKLSTE